MRRQIQELRIKQINKVIAKNRLGIALQKLFKINFVKKSKFNLNFQMLI